MDNKHQFTLWFWVAAIVLLFVAQAFLVGPHVETIPYSDFKTLLSAGKVRQATVNQDSIDAVIDLQGTKKLLPTAEYDEMKAKQGTEKGADLLQTGSSQGTGTTSAASGPPGAGATSTSTGGTV